MTKLPLEMFVNDKNAPGRRAIETVNILHKELVFKKPVGTARKRKKKVLNDESYVEVRHFCKFLMFLNTIHFRTLGK